MIVYASRSLLDLMADTTSRQSIIHIQHIDMIRKLNQESNAYIQRSWAQRLKKEKILERLSRVLQPKNMNGRCSILSIVKPTLQRHQTLFIDTKPLDKNSVIRNLQSTNSTASKISQPSFTIAGPARLFY